MQDVAFRSAVARSRFTAAARRLNEPFFVIAGYEESGKALAHALDELGYRVVIIESRADRVARIQVEDYLHSPLALAEDARWPEVLRDAGVTSPHCRAVLVLVGDDEVAQAIAIGAAALVPMRLVVARVHSTLARINLAGFNNITVIDSYETFATNLELSMAAPAVLWLEEWLSSMPGSACPQSVSMPKGHWVICSFGRFGENMSKALEKAGSSWIAIDANPDLPDHPGLLRRDNSLGSLREAGLDQAVGMVACTSQDALNLALVTRARHIRPDLCVLIRQNHAGGGSLIDAAGASLKFVESDVMAHECLQLLLHPLLNRFLLRVREQGVALAEQIIVRLLTELDERVPYLWGFHCLPSYPGLRAVLAGPPEQALTLAELMTDPFDPPTPMRVVPLLLLRDEQVIMMPAPETRLCAGDHILFAGAAGVQSRQRHFMLDPSPVEFVRTGVEPARSLVFRWLAKRRAAHRS